MVMERLEQMPWLGREIEAQMIAQEVYMPDGRVRHLLCNLDCSTSVFIPEDFEVGVVLPQEEGQWLAGLIENAMRLSTCMPDPRPEPTENEVNDNLEEQESNDMTNDNDEVMLMGWPRSRGREHPWSDRLRRRASRSRSSSRRPRNGERSRSGTEQERDRGREGGPGPRASRGHAPDTERGPRRLARQCYTESVRTLTPRRTSRDEALSANRHMWRDIMGMDSGPGTDSQFLAFAVDTSVLQNVIATTEPLQPLERLAFYTGFVRWLFEVMQLIMEAVVTRQLPTRYEDPEEGIMMMQTHSQLRQRVADGVRDLQRELEKGTAQCQDALRFMRVMLEDRYLGIYAWDEWHVGAQDFHALLVGHLEDADHKDCPPLTDLGRQFVGRWWKVILPTLRGLDQFLPGVQHTRLWEDPNLQAEREVQEELEVSGLRSWFVRDVKRRSICNGKTLSCRRPWSVCQPKSHG